MTIFESEAVGREEAPPSIPPSIRVEAPSSSVVPKLDGREEAFLSSPSIVELSDDRVSIPLPSMCTYPECEELEEENRALWSLAFFDPLGDFQGKLGSRSLSLECDGLMEEPEALKECNRLLKLKRKKTVLKRELARVKKALS